MLLRLILIQLFKNISICLFIKMGVLTDHKTRKSRDDQYFTSFIQADLRMMTGICTIVLCVCAQLCLTRCDPMDCVPWTARLLCPWDVPGKNIVVGCYFLLQGIVPTQGLNSHLLHFPQWQSDSLPLTPSGVKEVYNQNYWLIFLRGEEHGIYRDLKAT